MTLNLNNFHLAKSFGKITFCKKVINPEFDIKIEKKPAKEAAQGADKEKKGGKGEEKKGGKGEEKKGGKK